MDLAKFPNEKSYRAGEFRRSGMTSVHAFVTRRAIARFNVNKLNKVGNNQWITNSTRKISKLLSIETRYCAGLALSLPGSMLAYLLSKALGSGDRTSVVFGDNIVDDRGTDQGKAARILRNLRNRAFEASDEKLAIALGRPLDEVTGWSVGSELIDDDVVMKARGIAMHRGVRVE